MSAYMTSKEMSVLGRKLKAYRTDIGISQAELSTKLGYGSPQYVSNIERGLCAPPIEKLKKFVKILNLKTEQMEEISDYFSECFIRHMARNLL